MEQTKNKEQMINKQEQTINPPEKIINKTQSNRQTRNETKTKKENKI